MKRLECQCDLQRFDITTDAELPPDGMVTIQLRTHTPGDPIGPGLVVSCGPIEFLTFTVNGDLAYLWLEGGTWFSELNHDVLTVRDYQSIRVPAEHLMRAATGQWDSPIADGTGPAFRMSEAAFRRLFGG